MARNVFGPNEENLRLIEKRLKVEVVARGNVIRISGDQPNIDRARAFLDELFSDGNRGLVIDKFDFLASLDAICKEPQEGEEGGFLRIDIPNRKKFVYARTEKQN